MQTGVSKENDFEGRQVPEDKGNNLDRMHAHVPWRAPPGGEEGGAGGETSASMAALGAIWRASRTWLNSCTTLR